MTKNPKSKINISNKALILLADSQLLFFNQGQPPLLNRVRQQFGVDEPLTAAYIGAANGDQKEFYQIFQLAMQNTGITRCKHITSALTAAEQEFLNNAQIILLAGGDVWLGWQTLKKIAPLISQARQNGAVLIGISAGAVHLGQLGWFDKAKPDNNDLFPTFGYVPAIFSPHDEKQHWQHLRQVVAVTAGCLPGIGIPSGAGIIIQPDQTIAAIAKPAVKITLEGRQLSQQSLWQITL